MKSNNLCCFRCGGVEVTLSKVRNVTGGMKEVSHCDYCGANVPISKMTPSEDFVMPFGKHKGEKLSNIPRDYLEWLYNNANLRHGVKIHIGNMIK